MSSVGGLRFLFQELSQFYPPFVGMSFLGIPVAMNLYGIQRNKQHQFYDNKPNADASKFGGEKSIGGDSH